MSFMNLIPKPNVPRYSGLKLAEGVTSFIGASKQTLYLTNPIVFTRKGEFADTMKLAPSHTYRLVFGQVNIHPHFDLALKAHPDLHDMALVSYPSILSGGHAGQLSIIVRPLESIDLEELKYILGISIYE